MKYTPIPWFICQGHADAFLADVRAQTAGEWPTGGAVLKYPSARMRLFVERNRRGFVRVFNRRGGTLLLASDPKKPAQATFWRGRYGDCR